MPGEESGTGVDLGQFDLNNLGGALNGQKTNIGAAEALAQLSSKAQGTSGKNTPGQG